MKNLIIFDLDGTLIDSLHDLASGVNYTLRQLNHREVTIEYVKKSIGNGAQKLVERCLPSYPEVQSQELKEAMDIFLPYYNENCDIETFAYPGVIEYLEKLKDLELDLAVLTNKPEAPTHKILKALKLDSYFSAVIGGDTLAQKKPSPIGQIALMDQFSTRPENTLMIGDGEPDLASAQAAGVDSIAILDGIGDADTLKKYQPIHFINTFAELNDIEDIQFRSSK